MINNLFRASILGLIFCIGQSLVEAILGYFITHIRHTSDTNVEGSLLYAFVRFILTIMPYIAVFYLTFKTTTKLQPSIVAFGLNFIVIGYFYYAGLIQKDSISFLIASILTSISFIFIDKTRNLIKHEKQQESANA